MVELLARTGMRVGELAALRDDAMFRLGEHHWLRIEVGKLHNGRTVPCIPSWSVSSPTTGPNGHRSPGCWSSAAAIRPMTGAPSTATSPRWPGAPASAVSTPTNCATPSPPS